MLVIIKNSFAVLNIFTLPLLFKALVRPLLEYGNVIWGPQYKLDQQVLKKVLRRATKLLPQLKGRPKALKLPSLQYIKQKGNMIETFKIITGRVRLDHTLFFTFVSDTSRHGHIYKLYNQHAPRRVRVQSFGIRIMNEWNSLPRWVVEAGDLDMFKHNLDTHWHARQYLTPAYFSLFDSLFYGVASDWDLYQKYNSERVQRRAERFVNSRYSKYSSVSDMLDVLRWLPFSQKRYEARLILFYQIINVLAKCPLNASLLRRIRVL